MTTQITKDTLPDLSKGQGHKYDHGHLVVVSGGPGKTGAARLAARGALRVGAGLVTLACPVRAIPEVAAQVTAVMVHGLDGPPGLDELLEDARINSLCLGPGLGLTQTTAELVRVAQASGRTAVLDADALTRFYRDPDVLFDHLHAQTVLTPHMGEFHRLFPDLADLPAEKAVREASMRCGAVILLKGQTTWIAEPGGKIACHAATGARAVPWLATAGAGDVLAGFISGLLARHIAPFDAACAGAWLHGECALKVGPGLIAEDLPEALPAILRAVTQDQTVV